MARYEANTENDPSNLRPARATEQRAPQFIGGSIDPSTGNVIPSSRAATATGRQATIEQNIADSAEKPAGGSQVPVLDAPPPPPATPTSRLASVDAAPPRSTPDIDYGQVALNAGINAVTGGVSKVISDSLSGALFGGSGGSANPLDTVIGGGVNNTGAGSGGGGGGGGSSGPTFSVPIFSAPIYSGPPSYGSDSYFNNAYGGGGGGYSMPSYSGGGDSSSGSVLCSYFHKQGRLSTLIYDAEARYVERHVSPRTVIGYRAWAVPLVRIMQKGGPLGTRMARALWPIVEASVTELAFRSGALPKGNRIGRVLLAIGIPVCWCIGLFAHDKDWRALWTDASNSNPPTKVI